MAPWRKGASTEQSALMAASGGAAGGSASSAALQNMGQGLANSRRKQASVVEMLEYVKSLDIDPIKEADMLWIAEEAFSAALPPGWSEHQDDEGHIYFHNDVTGGSVWRHPMDDLFKEIVQSQRTVVRDGGFHRVEDEIAELEENIRRDLADWMELFDEHGEKFFYNRRTDDSRFDDPRMAVYHNLYTRIKMVAKMKERLPSLARAPRPEEPTEQELELRRRQLDEEERYLKCVIKVQSLGRVCIAKRKVRNVRAQATVHKGHQPLRGKFRLRMDKTANSGKRELVLAMTTPHRRHRAATKLQARVRGILARKKLRPLIQHRAFLSKIVTKIQARARVWLARRRAVRQRQSRKDDAAIMIQRSWRGRRDRIYVGTLAAQRARYVFYVDSVHLLQRWIRKMLHKLRLQRKHEGRKLAAFTCIKAQAEVMRARMHLERVKFYTDEDSATKIQALARGRVSRKRVKFLRQVAKDGIKDIMDSVWRDVKEREKAAARMQGSIRMQETQKQGLLAKKRQEFMERVSEHIEVAQAQFKVYVEQTKLAALMQHETVDAATKIQAVWRGKSTRDRMSGKRKEVPLVIKGTFEYHTNKSDGVSVEVKFEPSPGFDDYKYIVENGRPAVVALGSSIKNLHDQLRGSMTEIHELLDGVPADYAVTGGASSSTANAPPAPAPVEAPVAQAAAASRLQSKASDARKPSAQQQALPQQETRPPSKPLAKAAPKAVAAKPGSAAAAQLAPMPPQQAAPPERAAAQQQQQQQQRQQPPAAQAPAAQQLVQQQAQPVQQEQQPHPQQPQQQQQPQQPQPQPQPPQQQQQQQQQPVQPLQPLQPLQQGSMSASQEVTMQPPHLQQELQQARQPLQQVSEEATRTATMGMEADAEADTTTAYTTKKSKKASTSPQKKKAPSRIPSKPSEALDFLSRAGQQFSDKKPSPHPDDPVPRPPASNLPSDPPPPQGLRGSQSEGALQPGARKTYAGTMKDGKFVKAQVDTIEDLPEQDRMQVLEDIERERQAQHERILEKAQMHKARKQQEQQSRAEKFKAQRAAVEAQEEERRRKKALEMKKWLKAKDDIMRSKKAKSDEMMKVILDKEREKAEGLKKLEEQRHEERERRLKIAEKQKAKLEMHMLMQRQGIAMGGGSPIKGGVDMFAQQQSQQQRVVHRHVHHHMHYGQEEANSSGEEYAFASDEERRGMESAAEARSFHKGGKGGGVEWEDEHARLPPVDNFAETPTMKQRAYSEGNLRHDDGLRMSRTQQAFKRGGLPQLQNYNKGLQKAMGSYADSGRPRRLLQSGGVAPAGGYY